MNSNWEYYKIFYYVGKHGSFTQAARFLHNNQPNITRVINMLESDLGCRLFVRSQKGVTLTPDAAGTEVRYEADTLMLSVGLLPENELSRAAGIELSPITRGPVVTESLETSVSGIFACGNVLHVHDLVDYVSEEATAAGRSAAGFVEAGGSARSDAEPLTIVPSAGVRYTVPVTVDVTHMADTLKVRFRVDNVYRNRYVSVYVGERRLVHRKRQIMAPGEMEDVTLKREDLAGLTGEKVISVLLEEA